MTTPIRTPHMPVGSRTMQGHSCGGQTLISASAHINMPNASHTSICVATQRNTEESATHDAGSMSVRIAIHTSMSTTPCVHRFYAVISLLSEDEDSN